jgi:SEC-C motif-containing protein
MSCTCGNDAPFESCCGPFLAGDALPPTAEALLRSRYSAFVRGEIDYVVATHAAKTRGEVDRATTEAWSRESTWLGLRIMEVQGGSAGDDRGRIEFTASYRQNGESHLHHEIATFERIGDRWYFVDGQQPKQAPRRVEKRPGRNDPCSCGSGKKFKKCCGSGD